jgi:hypothetical protein
MKVQNLPSAVSAPYAEVSLKGTLLRSAMVSKSQNADGGYSDTSPTSARGMGPTGGWPPFPLATPPSD